MDAGLTRQVFMVTQFLGKREAERLTGLSHETLKKYRLNGILTEGIHWIRINPRVVRYNAMLLLDFLQNRNDRNAHQRAIGNYQASLLSNQPCKPGRPRKAISMVNPPAA